jgi:hypothetical protein
MARTCNVSYDIIDALRLTGLGVNETVDRSRHFESESRRVVQSGRGRDISGSHILRGWCRRSGYPRAIVFRRVRGTVGNV